MTPLVDLLFEERALLEQLARVRELIRAEEERTGAPPLPLRPRLVPPDRHPDKRPRRPQEPRVLRAGPSPSPTRDRAAAARRATEDRCPRN
jgi:hypothetical protein